MGKKALKQYEISVGGLVEVYSRDSVLGKFVRHLEFREVITVYKERDDWWCISEDGSEWILDIGSIYIRRYHGEELFPIEEEQ